MALMFNLRSSLLRTFRSVNSSPALFARMASTAPPKYEFLVILPDKPGALSTRMDVRPKHLAGIGPKFDNGEYFLGGAILEEVPKEGEGLKIKGSVMLAYAESKEAVIEDLKKDIYSESGVWDWDKVEIFPFKSALRKGM